MHQKVKYSKRSNEAILFDRRQYVSGVVNKLVEELQAQNRNLTKRLLADAYDKRNFAYSFHRFNGTFISFLDEILFNFLLIIS